MQILTLILDHFEFPPDTRQRVETLFNDSGPAFRTLSAEDVADVGRAARRYVVPIAVGFTEPRERTYELRRRARTP